MLSSLRLDPDVRDRRERPATNDHLPRHDPGRAHGCPRAVAGLRVFGHAPILYPLQTLSVSPLCALEVGQIGRVGLASGSSRMKSEASMRSGGDVATCWQLSYIRVINSACWNGLWRIRNLAVGIFSGG